MSVDAEKARVRKLLERPLTANMALVALRLVLYGRQQHWPIEEICDHVERAWTPPGKNRTDTERGD